MNKVCSKCNLSKDPSEFPKQKHGRVCKLCRNKQQKDWRTRNPGKYSIYSKRWQVKYPDRYKASTKKWEKANRTKDYLLQYRYGITEKQFEEIATSQNSSCAICHDGDRELVVDHDHVTNQVRGLLCKPCNMALGLLRDNPDIIHSAKEYITFHKS